MSEVTRILSAIEQGDPGAANELLPLVYGELRKLAADRMAGEKPGQTLQPTALVHEAYLRLVGSDATQPWNSRGHFFAAAAEAMRRIMINHARDKNRQKRSGGWRRLDIASLDLAENAGDDELEALHEALERLSALNRPCAELIRLRFFAGLTQTEAAAAMALPPRTAARYWSYARAWLFEDIRSRIEGESEDSH